MTAVSKTRKYLAIISVFLLVASTVSLALNLTGTHRQYRELATVMGRSFFQTILATREWNAELGGVYGRVSDRLQPNQYLDDPLRDVVTTQGLRLTKINPAYMTRMVSEILDNREGIKIHITSLRPIRPENRADEWEAGALAAFEKGVREQTTLVRSSDAGTFRYMAPLLVDTPCLTCHARQGYKAGDVRGGISVTFSYAPFQAAITAHDREIVLIHIFFLVAGFAIIHFLGSKLIARVRELHDALSLINRLEGILPICSNCKKIRTEGDGAEQKGWVNIEEYLMEKTDAEFSHGICPECYKALYGDFLDRERRKQEPG